MIGQVGPRGLTVLVIVGVAGLLLAFLGWSQRGAGVPPRGPAQPAAYVATAGAAR